MISDDELKELAIRIAKQTRDGNEFVLKLARAIEAECRLPVIEGLVEAITDNPKTPEQWVIIGQAATAYLKASRGE